MSTERFEAQIRLVKPRKPSLPLQRLVLEARQLADFVERYWEPRRARGRLPGLGAAAEAAGIKREVARDLRDLAGAVQSTDSELKATRVRVERLPLAAARAALRELRAPLRFLLGAPERSGLARIEQASHGRSAYALALALEAHAALAEKHADALARLGDFAADLPERARRLALSLREPRRDVVADEARRAKLRSRDALMTLLMERMRAVRGAARYVFRDHPRVLEQATSDYERKRKRKRARKLARTRSKE